MRKMTIFNFTWKNSTMRYRPGSTSAEGPKNDRKKSIKLFLKIINQY